MERTASNPPDVIRIDERLELRPLVPGHAADLYALVEANRERLGRGCPGWGTTTPWRTCGSTRWIGRQTI